MWTQEQTATLAKIIAEERPRRGKRLLDLFVYDNGNEPVPHLEVTFIEATETANQHRRFTIYPGGHWHAGPPPQEED